jgi:hypothetical protein
VIRKNQEVEKETGYTRECSRYMLFRAFSGFSRRVKNGSFFTFFQLRSTGYAPSKTQKLTKNQPVFANGRKS